MRTKLLSFIPFFLLFFLSCKRDYPFIKEWKSTKVIVVVIDGPRYQETFGEPNHTYIPYQSALCKEGTLCTSFYNEGTTNTVNGHTAICTGNYESLNNAGLDIPTFPSFFQYYIEQKKAPASKAWIIASKDKLEVLANCSDKTYMNKFQPSTDCGINGLATGYREDSITQKNVLNTLQQMHPDLMLVNYREPDFSGHANNWNNYIKGIQQTDKYVAAIWDYIQSDPYYKDQTMLFITNDHGRHNDGWKDGFVSHGDDCSGCRHIALLALGTDIKKNYTCNLNYSQIDITTTIAAIFNLNMPYANGKIIDDIIQY